MESLEWNYLCKYINDNENSKAHVSKHNLQVVTIKMK